MRLIPISIRFPRIKFPIRFLMKHKFSLLLIFLFLLTACTPGSTPTSTGETPDVATATEVPTATPTEEPVAVLNVCTVGLPDGLFPYDGKNPAAKQTLLDWTRLELSNGSGMGLLAEMPTESNGGITLQPVTVQTGEIVVDAGGAVTTLKAGVTVRPSGCRSSDCAVAWDGIEPLSMDQMTVTFDLSAGLSWSDGTPLTAADSVLSFELASDPAAPGLKWVESRTSGYVAQGEDQIVWTGKPGFTTADIESLFWQPVPAHLFEGGAEFQAVADAALWSGVMPSLGRYQVAEWTESAIRLVENELLSAAVADSLLYGEINLQVVPSLEGALAALESGGCDVLDSSYHLEQAAETLDDLGEDASLTLMAAQTDSWMQLVFGIQPASYDDYYNPLYGDRPDYFGDIRTRQAVAACLDRDAIQQALYGGLGEQWPSFVSPAESTLAQDQGVTHDPALGSQLLEAAGWRDHDQDPSTPLQAWYIGNIPAGTPFSIQFYSDSSAVSQQVAAIVQSSLGQCGIEVTPVSLPAAELYETSTEGPLFGRQFDLALMGWSPSPQLDCALYESSQVPSEENGWIGTNIAGLAELSYDAACNDGSLALPSEKESALGRAEQQYLDALPAVPLISVPEVLAVRSAACSAVEALWAGDSGFSGCR